MTSEATSDTELALVIATYNRGALLFGLLSDLCKQTLEHSRFEVIIVDDGSTQPAQEIVASRTWPFAMAVVRQDNAGPAVARDRGIRMARAPIVVIVDDDMGLPATFLEAHLEAHKAGATVVLGRIVPAESIDQMPLFERFHARFLERLAKSIREGKTEISGLHLCTGNVSMRRQAYLDVGGFDHSLGRSEDRDLGVRLEMAGEHLVLCDEAFTVHRSDHEKVEMWRQRAYLYGRYDKKIARKHPGSNKADPWRYFDRVNPVSRPLLLLTAAFPSVGPALREVVLAAAFAFDARGHERAALAGTTLAYGLEYFRGLRHESGSRGQVIRDLLAYRRRLKQSESLGAVRAMLASCEAAIRKDHEALWGHRLRYQGEVQESPEILRDSVTKIGFQMMASVRLMQAFRDHGWGLSAQVVSRLIRYLYGAEIHWEAALEPGITIVHGNGLVISSAASVGCGSILFHNVTLGQGVHPDTREVGAPSLGANVHVGPGATLIGPITIGEGSKIAAGAVVTRSLPPNSLVMSPACEIGQRQARTKPHARVPSGKEKAPVRARSKAKSHRVAS